jgi:phosphatidylglycerophosphate synthase
LDGAGASPRVDRRGGFLDISLDFLFYALVPFGFILADPAQNAVAGGWLLFSLSEPAAVFWPLPRWRQSIR